MRGILFKCRPHQVTRLRGFATIHVDYRLLTFFSSVQTFGSTGRCMKLNTPSDPYYLSLVWINLDTEMCLDTFILATSNMDRRE
jgi:hypothetical protein